MNSNTKTFIGILLGFLVLSFLVYWAGVNAPKKEILIHENFSQYLDNKEALPSYGITYQWDGVTQEMAWWLVLRIRSEWKIVPFTDSVNKDIEDWYRVPDKFDRRWILENKFSAQLTRWEMVVLLMGAEPTYAKEKKAFLEVLDKIEEFERSNKKQ